jgi:endoribonuclease Dicer
LDTFLLQPADAFVNSRPQPNTLVYLYHVTMTLTGPITEDQNTRGRKIYAPEETTQSFGVLLASEVPNVSLLSLSF